MSDGSHGADHSNQALRRTSRSDAALDTQALETAIHQLVEQFQPDRVILFGSLVQGHSRPESSVDVLVVAPGVGSMRLLDRIKKAIQVTDTSLPNIAPLVYTPDELQLLVDQGDGFIADLLDEGKVLYQRSS